MKTTMEITDGLFQQAKAVARRDGTTVRALVEAGLRSVLKQRRAQSRFRLRDASFAGKGLRPELQHAKWDEVRDALYEDHGA